MVGRPTAVRMFVAHAPPEAAIDRVQRDWNARQWRELQAYLRQLEARVQELEADTAVAPLRLYEP